MVLGAALAGVALASCAGDFDPQSRVDKLRILGIRAEPPLARPGDSVAVESLVADPAGEGRPLAYLWAACLLGPSGSIDACGDPSGGNIVGFALTERFSFAVPPLPPDTEAATVLLILSVCAGGTFAPPGEGGSMLGPACEGGDAAMAYKRVRLTTTDETNHNPAAVDGVALDGVTVPVDEPLIVPGCSGVEDCLVHTMSVALPPDTAEPYTVIEFGTPQELLEEVFVSWYSTLGDFGRGRSGLDDPTVQWLQPEGPGEATFWIVAHDGRGGAVWTTRRIRFEGGTAPDGGGDAPGTD